MIAPLAVAVEIRALDVGRRLLRAFRLSESIAEEGVRLAGDLPFESGRPVSAELALPDDPAPLRLTGVVATARTIELRALAAEDRRRIARYVQERMLLP